MALKMPSGKLTYLPPAASGLGARMADGSPPPITRRVRGAETRSEDIGSPVGRRGAGMTSLGGGDAGAHTFNHYGKNPPGLVGGNL